MIENIIVREAVVEREWGAWLKQHGYKDSAYLERGRLVSWKVRVRELVGRARILAWPALERCNWHLPH